MFKYIRQTRKEIREWVSEWTTEEYFLFIEGSLRKSKLATFTINLSWVENSSTLNCFIKRFTAFLQASHRISQAVLYSQWCGSGLIVFGYGPTKFMNTIRIRIQVKKITKLNLNHLLYGKNFFSSFKSVPNP